jgi:hypothetical protein
MSDRALHIYRWVAFAGGAGIAATAFSLFGWQGLLFVFAFTSFRYCEDEAKNEIRFRAARRRTKT